MDNARKPSSRMSILLDGKWCHGIEKIVTLVHAGDKEGLVSPFHHHQFGMKNVILSQARNSGHGIDQAMIVKTLNKCKSRRQWRTDQDVQRCVKSDRRAGDHVALLRRTRVVIEIFAPFAEGAILGTSRGTACICAEGVTPSSSPTASNLCI